MLNQKVFTGKSYNSLVYEFMTDIDLKQKFLSEYPSTTPSSDIVPETAHIKSNSMKAKKNEKRGRNDGYIHKCT